MVKQINRRELLKLSAVAAVSTFGVVAYFELRAGKRFFSHWGSTSPEAAAFFTREERVALEGLTSVIIPADERSGGAREAKAGDFIALVVGSSREETKKIWKDGLKELAALSPDRQTALLNEASRTEQQTALGQFYRELKSKTVHAYYTSEIGLRADLRYLGKG